MKETYFDEKDTIGIKQREKIIQENPISLSELKKRKKELQSVANNTLKKKPIHINITAHVLDDIKRQALRKGMPYQTYINHILHKVVSREIVLKD
jgi:predicted DNA binding CopG/RHH family protein